jgi:hypothetical protein
LKKRKPMIEDMLRISQMLEEEEEAHDRNVEDFTNA